MGSYGGHYSPGLAGGGGERLIAIIILVGFGILYTGVMLLSGMKYAFNKEDRQSKLISGIFATSIGATLLGGFLFYMVWIILNVPPRDMYEGVSTIVLFAGCAIACLYAYYQNTNFANYYVEQAAAARILGICGTILFLILALLGYLSLSMIENR
jgi:hypothetical protein